MDPNAAWKALNAALSERDRQGVFDYADALVGWLDGQGFMPTIPEWDWRSGLTRKQFIEMLRQLRRVADME